MSEKVITELKEEINEGKRTLVQKYYKITKEEITREKFVEMKDKQKEDDLI